LVEVEILAERQHPFQCVEMADEVNRFADRSVAIRIRHPTGGGRQEPGHYAQKRRFTAAIRAADENRLARADRKGKVLEQRATAADRGQTLRPQHRTSQAPEPESRANLPYALVAVTALLIRYIKHATASNRGNKPCPPSTASNAAAPSRSAPKITSITACPLPRKTGCLG